MPDDTPADAPADVLARIRTVLRPVVLVDGRSGSGKTTLAAFLAPALTAQLVRLDDLYPGWHGLEAASARVASQLLDPVNPRWQAWDWDASVPGRWHEIDASRPLVVEGSGALSRASRALASFAIWVELDDVTRKQRALARDGSTYEPHWEKWAAQEETFAARENPKSLADVVFSDADVLGMLTGLASYP